MEVCGISFVTSISLPMYFSSFFSSSASANRSRFSVRGEKKVREGIFRNLCAQSPLVFFFTIIVLSLFVIYLSSSYFCFFLFLLVLVLVLLVIVLLLHHYHHIH